MTQEDKHTFILEEQEWYKLGLNRLRRNKINYEGK